MPSGVLSLEYLFWYCLFLKHERFLQKNIDYRCFEEYSLLFFLYSMNEKESIITQYLKKKGYKEYDPTNPPTKVNYFVVVVRGQLKDFIQCNCVFVNSPIKRLVQGQSLWFNHINRTFTSDGRSIGFNVIGYAVDDVRARVVRIPESMFRIVYPRNTNKIDSIIERRLHYSMEGKIPKVIQENHALWTHSPYRHPFYSSDTHTANYNIYQSYLFYK